MFKDIYRNKIKTAVIVAGIFIFLSVIVYYISYALGYGEYAVFIAVAVSLLTSLALASASLCATAMLLRYESRLSFCFFRIYATHVLSFAV